MCVGTAGPDFFFFILKDLCRSSISPACMSVHLVHGAHRGQKVVVDRLELELQMVVSHVGPGN